MPYFLRNISKKYGTSSKLYSRPHNPINLFITGIQAPIGERGYSTLVQRNSGFVINYKSIDCLPTKYDWASNRFIRHKLISPDSMHIWIRSFAYMGKEKHKYSLINDTLRRLDTKYTIEGFISNEETLRFIEQFVSNEYAGVESTKNYVASVDTSILGKSVSDYVNGKLEMLNKYIDTLFLVSKQNATNKKNISADFLCDVLNRVGKDFILSICIHHFLVTLTHQDTDTKYSNCTIYCLFLWR